MRWTMLALIVFLGLAHAHAQEVEWIHQFGTPGFDQVGPVATHHGHPYVAGSVGGGEALPGQLSQGATDSFVRKYDPDGTVLWTRQFGTPGADRARELVTQGGAVTVAGSTSDAFPGEVFAGGVDVFVRQYDTAGAELWTRQFGTPGFDVTLGLAVEPSGIYIFGATSGVFPGETPAGGFDLFLAKLDHGGGLHWARQFGSPGNDPFLFLLGGLAADASGVYVGSSVALPLPGQVALGDAEAVVRKYDHDGNELWTRQLGTACLDLLSAIRTGPDGVYVAGSTTGVMSDPLLARCTQPPIPYNNYGDTLMTFVQALSPEGDALWTAQDGQRDESDKFSLAIDLAVDDRGVYVTGEILGSRDPGAFDPECPVGTHMEDIRIRAYDLNGVTKWTRRIGSTDSDPPQGIAVSDTALYVGGVTHCQLAGQVSAGSADGLVLKLTPLP